MTSILTRDDGAPNWLAKIVAPRPVRLAFYYLAPEYSLRNSYLFQYDSVSPETRKKWRDRKLFLEDKSGEVHGPEFAFAPVGVDDSSIKKTAETLRRNDESFQFHIRDTGGVMWDQEVEAGLTDGSVEPSEDELFARGVHQLYYFDEDGVTVRDQYRQRVDFAKLLPGTEDRLVSALTSANPNTVTDDLEVFESLIVPAPGQGFDPFAQPGRPTRASSATALPFGSADPGKAEQVREYLDGLKPLRGGPQLPSDPSMGNDSLGGINPPS